MCRLMYLLRLQVHRVFRHAKLGNYHNSTYMRHTPWMWRMLVSACQQSPCCASLRRTTTLFVPPFFVPSVFVDEHSCRSSTYHGVNDEELCGTAAWNGDLAMLKWARENGRPWSEGTCYYAAESGHLEVLKWARENVCPWDAPRCLGQAKSLDRKTVVEWITNNMW